MSKIWPFKAENAGPQSTKKPTIYYLALTQKGGAWSNSLNGTPEQPFILRLLEPVRMVAQKHVKILIKGESGTGKELVGKEMDLLRVCRSIEALSY